MTQENKEYQKTFKRNKWFFSTGIIGHDMVYSLVVSYLLTFVQFGVRLTVTQYLVLSLFIGVVGRIWDAITDPLMGLIIQKCNFKWGKYRPWIFIGAVLTGMLTVFLFNTNLQGWGFVVYIIIMNLLWELAYTMNDISYWSMLPSLSSDTKERNLVSTMTLFFAGMGGGIVQGLITIFQTGNFIKAYSIISIVSAIAIIFSQGWTAFFVKERPSLHQDEKIVSIKEMFTIIFKNKQLIVMAIALGLYTIGNGLFVSLLYNIYYIEMGYNADIVTVLIVFALFSTLVQVLFPYLSKKFSKKKILTFATICSLLGYFVFLIIGWLHFLPFNLITMSIAGFLIYSGNSLIYLITVISITNCVEYNEYLTGNRDEAIISTVRPFITKMSTAIKYGLTSLILIISGVFTLSQNVSTIEIQKTYFSKIESKDGMSKFEIQKIYLETIQNYTFELEGINDESLYQETLNRIDEELINNSLLCDYKLEADYIITCSKMYVLENNQMLGQIKDLDLSLLKENAKYELSIVGYYTNEDGKKIRYNTGDLCFRDISNTGERVMLRVFATILPIICIFFSWFVQYRYNKIDEVYYEKIVHELELRKNQQIQNNDENSKEL